MESKTLLHTSFQSYTYMRLKYVWRNRNSIFEQIWSAVVLNSCERYAFRVDYRCWKYRLHRLNSSSQSRVNAHSGGHVVVLHFDHDFFVHCQLGRVPHRREDGFTDRERRGSCKADENQIRGSQRRQHCGLFQSKIRWITYEWALHKRKIVLSYVRYRSWVSEHFGRSTL